MPRTKTADSDITAIRADIADLVKSLGRLESEITETRAAVARVDRDGATTRKAHNGNGHHGPGDFLAGAAKVGDEAAHVAGAVVHTGVSWLDEMLHKNPTPIVLAALGVGFVLGTMGRR